MSRAYDRDRLMGFPPMEFHWAGWHAESRELESNGWRLFTEPVYRHAFRIGMKYKGHAYGVSMVDSRHMDYHRGKVKLPVHMELCNSIYVAPSAFNPPACRASDMQGVAESRPFSTTFHQLPESQLYVPKPTFDELQDMLLDMQADKQKEIREKKRRIIPNEGAIIRVVS